MKRAPTPSDPDRSGARRLRARREQLLAPGGPDGADFGAALADTVDAALGEAAEAIPALGEPGLALVALGSYARRELCPGSDLDVLLVADRKGRSATRVLGSASERCWYPLWDAGFVTGHASRTLADSLALASDDLDALTSFLEVRVVAGDAAVGRALEAGARRIAAHRPERVLKPLAAQADRRRLHPGPVADVLEPDLKEGSGGLRDGQALGWAGWAVDSAGGLDALVATGALSSADRHMLDAAMDELLEARVALHRVTGGRSDRLVLQEQDAVAARLGVADADSFVRSLAAAARRIAWIARDVWSTVLDGVTVSGPAEAVAPGITVSGGRVLIKDPGDGSIPAAVFLEAAATAAERRCSFDRDSLGRLGAAELPAWDVWQRAAFLRLLRSGAGAVDVFEALDHVGALGRVLPEWDHVRSLPQRNAYHRFTVDRHLLETVAECAALLDAGDATTVGSGEFDARVARSCRRPELLLLGALLHDIDKGRPGDHAVLGEATADAVARRIGLDSEGREILRFLVRDHLLLADTATRRDLSDPVVVDGIAAACVGDGERLRLLYLLTIGDSRATGPAAWSPTKAALLRDLFVKTAASIERGEALALAADRRDALGARLGAERAAAFTSRLPDAYLLAVDVDTMVDHESLLAGVGTEPVVRCTGAGHEVVVTVAAPDRPGLLATLSGAMAACGLDVTEAGLFVTSDGTALDVFRATDPFGRATEDP
ncbi:MAG: HD domain-containing protein, partial [Actinomycetota bacterium]